MVLLNWLLPKFRHVVVFVYLAIALGIILYLQECELQETTKVKQTDTVYVDRPYKEVVIREVEVEKPVKVYVYKVDTVYRKAIEKDTLVSSVELTPKLARVHAITPEGLPLIKEYSLDGFEEVKINHKGSINISQDRKKKKRKKFFKTVEKIAIFVGGIIIGNQL